MNKNEQAPESIRQAHSCVHIGSKMPYIYFASAEKHAFFSRTKAIRSLNNNLASFADEGRRSVQYVRHTKEKTQKSMTFNREQAVTIRTKPYNIHGCIAVCPGHHTKPAQGTSCGLVDILCREGLCSLGKIDRATLTPPGICWMTPQGVYQLRLQSTYPPIPSAALSSLWI